MKNHSQIESRKFHGKNYYTAYHIDGGIWHVRKHAGGYWYGTERDGHGTITGSTLDEINRKLLGGTQ